MANARRYHRDVADDLNAATAYYDQISLELGNSFRDSLRRCIEVITARPASFGRIHASLRASMVEQFPYVLLFSYDDEKEIVFVLGVFHASSDRGRWFERTL